MLFQAFSGMSECVGIGLADARELAHLSHTILRKECFGETVAVVVVHYGLNYNHSPAHTETEQ